MRLAITTFLAATGILTACLTAQAAEPTYQGQFVQGGIVFGQTDAGATVVLDDEVIDTIAPDGRFILGFPRDYEGPAKLSIKHADGSVESFAYDIGDREFNIQRIDGLPEKMVTPDPRLLRASRMIPAKRAKHEPSVSTKTSCKADLFGLHWAPSQAFTDRNGF